MEKALAPLYDHLLLQVVFGVLVWANVALLTRTRYESMLPRFYADRAALTYYQQSGFWLGALAGFVAAMLPEMLVPVVTFVLVVVAATWLLAARIENRMYSDAQA